MFNIMNEQQSFVKPNKAESGANQVTQQGSEKSQDPADPDTPAGIVALVSMSLRRERARAALSLTELARRAGIAKSTLSQLESGTGNPSLETLWALGTALGVPLSRLIDPPRSDIRVIRADEGVVMQAERDPYEAAMLASCPPGARRDIYRVSAAPGTAHRARAHTAGTVEHLVLGAGRVLAGPEGAAVELGPGDYLRYPGDVPHIFHALEPHTVGIIVMEHV
jgi:transcriptional regulator with XRE-family HTH domain